MDLEFIQNKKKEIEEKFNKTNEELILMEKGIPSHKEELFRLQGEYRLLTQLESELSKKPV